MRSSRIFIIVLIFIFVFSFAACSSQPDGVQASSGNQTIENKGSDTMVNLALAWAEAYKSVKPDILISVTGGGSGTGITALINKTVDIANASRAIKDEEIKAMKANGVDPVEFIVARDAIAVIVNPENPVKQLTIPQLSAIYSGEIKNWKEVGGEDRPIVRLSRETNSGTHVYFLENVLRMGNSKNKIYFSSDTLMLPSSEGITAEVRDNPNAIGYDGLGYVIPEVKVLAVSKTSDGTFVFPSAETVNNKTYPIARDLYMYTAGQPNQVEKDYLDWIMSATGQKIVTELGFVPILTP